MTTINLDEYFSKGDQWLNSTLKKQVVEVFPDGFQLVLEYNQDDFDTIGEPGSLLSKTISLLYKLDIPFFYVTIKTSYQDIVRDFQFLKNLYAPYEVDISFVSSQVEFVSVQQKYDSFCILPWIHYYVNPQGDILSCCSADDNLPLGNITNIPYDDIPNLDTFKKLRKQFLNNERPAHCKSCWDKENTGDASFRMQVTKKYAHHKNLILETDSNGHLENFKMRYADFRDNNLCNLKCRMCSGKFSSAIAQEDFNIWGDRRYIELSNIKDNKNTILDFLDKNIEYIETIYFAGGEPLLLDSHYKILDLLLKRNKNCEINYNTNLTTLKFKNINVLDYWEGLPNVRIGASIDLTGDRAAYVRHGTIYKDLIDNYLQIRKYVKFELTSILSLYNIFDLPKLQKEWIELGVAIDHVTFTNLYTPESMSIQVLPKHFKDQATLVINEHIKWLSEFVGSEKLIKSWEQSLIFMHQLDASYLLSDFFHINDVRDNARNENFESVFPEYRDLRQFVI